MARGPRPERRPRRDDPNVGPSDEWGWHGSFPRGYRIAGVGAIGLLICFLLTTRDFELGAAAVPWLVGAAVVIGLGLLHSARRHR
jgi:hypothetical protein